MEAGRPDSITEEKLRILKQFPVDRISVNPQTMNQETLDRIGRQHTVEETARAFAMAREAGFDNINMDLILGLPEETEEDVARTIAETFVAFQRAIPWIALALLGFIGGKMLLEGLRGDDGDEEEGQCSASALSTRDLLIQGIATSIDALSVGFTIEELPVSMALTESLIIGLVTFGICLAGIQIGSRAGTKLKGKASMLGGVILILIGVEICLKGVL